MHVKIALKVVKAWDLVQMKLLSCRSKIELGANMAVLKKGVPLKGKNEEDDLLAFNK